MQSIHSASKWIEPASPLQEIEAVKGLTARTASLFNDTKECEFKAAKHLILINDVVSWDRESNNGSSVYWTVNAVQLAKNEFDIGPEGAKAVIETAAGRYEKEAGCEVRTVLAGISPVEEVRLDETLSEEIEKVLKGLEARMKGTGRWLGEMVEGEGSATQLD